MQRNVFIQLVVVSTDLTESNQVAYIVSTSEDSVVLPLEPLDTIGNIVAKYTDIDIGWMNPRLFGLVDKSTELYIQYYAMLPMDVELQHGHWLLLSEADNDIKSLARQAINLTPI